MADGSFYSSTVKRAEKSTRAQHEAKSYEADKENRAGKESGSSTGVVKNIAKRYEELSKSRDVTVNSTKNASNTGAVKRRIVVDNKSIECSDETSATSKKRVVICEDDAFAKPRFKVYEDKNPNIIKKSVHNVVGKEAGRCLQQGGLDQNFVKHQQKSLEPRARFSTVQPRFTPTDPPLVPLVLKKVKVQHRQSLMNADEKPKGPTIFTSRCYTYKLPYSDEFMQLEMEKYRSPLRESKGLRHQNITHKQRNIIVKFLTKVNAHLFYPSVFLYQTVKIFDGVLDAKPIGVEELQLTALAAMWISLKMHQTVYKVPSAAKMLSFSNDLYEGKTELLVQCEREILQSLNYEIAFPDPFSILCYDITKCSYSIFIDEKQTELAYYCGGYMIDLSLFDEDLMNTSVVLLVAAAAETALFFVMDDVNSGLEPVWSKWRAPHTAKEYSDAEISRVRLILLDKISESSRRHTDGEIVFKKYSRSRYGKVSQFLGNKVRLFLAPECPMNLSE